eukprot:scaffold261971_cov29-Prasinocladus_malaysianus.AAC.1
MVMDAPQVSHRGCARSAGDEVDVWLEGAWWEGRVLSGGGSLGSKAQVALRHHRDPGPRAWL